MVENDKCFQQDLLIRLKRVTKEHLKSKING